MLLISWNHGREPHESPGGSSRSAFQTILPLRPSDFFVEATLWDDPKLFFWGGCSWSWFYLMLN